MVENDTAARRVASSATFRRLAMLAISIGAWLACFAALAHLGSWKPFALGGVAIAAAGLALGVVPSDFLRPSLGKIGIGLLAGLVMIALTHAGYAVVAPLVPEVRSATARLFELLNVGGFPPAARAGLIVIIATCEEVLFRGSLPGAPATREEHRLHRMSRGDMVWVVAVAAGYALATVTLGSALLAVCAFVCGLLWGLMRMATGSLVVPIVAHVVWDLGVLVAWPLAAGQ